MSLDRNLPPRWDDMVPPDTRSAAAEPPVDQPVAVRPGRRQRSASAARGARPFVFGIAATFFGLWLYAIIAPPPRPLSGTDVDQRIVDALASQTVGPPDSQAVYSLVAPAFVLVQSELAAGAVPSGGSAPGTSGELGSGVVVNTRGDIMTSLHVVANATSIRVTFSDGTSAPATIARAVPENDIAVLRAVGMRPAIAPATLGDPHRLRIGGEAFVVGNPFGLYGSISAGVVSGLDRSFQMPNGGPVLHGLIQVDAAVNPGNSGGPLIERNGLVVGIVTGLVNPSPNSVFAGIGLAVPIDVAVSGVGMPPD
jgi:S1-C subfamily serine protease